MKWYLITHNGKTYRIPAANDAEAIASASNMLNLRGILEGVQPRVLSPGGVPDDQLRAVLGSSNVIDLSGTSTPGGDDGTQWDGHTGTPPQPVTTPPSYGAFSSAKLAAGNKYTDEGGVGGIRGSFTRALAGRGINMGGSMGGYYDSMQNPYQTGFEAKLNSGQGGAMEMGNQPFQSYVSGQQNPYEDILSAFRQGSGMQTGAGIDSGNMKGYVSPETAGEYGDANNLFQQSLQGRVGGYAASLLGRGMGNAQDQYSAQPLADKGSQNYLAFLRQRLGLGNIQF